MKNYNRNVQKQNMKGRRERGERRPKAERGREWKTKSNKKI